MSFSGCSRSGQSFQGFGHEWPLCCYHLQAKRGEKRIGRESGLAHELWFLNFASLWADIPRTGKITPNTFQNGFTWRTKDNIPGNNVFFTFFCHSWVVSGCQEQMDSGDGGGTLRLSNGRSGSGDSSWLRKPFHPFPIGRVGS